MLRKLLYLLALPALLTPPGVCPCRLGAPTPPGAQALQAAAPEAHADQEKHGNCSDRQESPVELTTSEQGPKAPAEPHDDHECHCTVIKGVVPTPRIVFEVTASPFLAADLHADSSEPVKGGETHALPHAPPLGAEGAPIFILVCSFLI